MDLLLAKNLKNLRINSNLSQESIANLLQISKQAWSNYENGHREPDLLMLLKISSYFKISIDALITKDLFSTNNDLNNINILNNSIKEFNMNTLFKSLNDLKIKYEKNIKSINKSITDLEKTKKLNLLSLEKNKKALKNLEDVIQFIKINNKISDVEIGTEISSFTLNKNFNYDIEELYQEEFDYLSSKYNYNNLIDLFRPINQIGDVSCGTPKYAFEDIERTFLLPKSYLHENDEYFILKAKGDSMNKLFNNGEKLLVKQSSFANNGDIVVAFIPKTEEATCKKYFVDDDDEISLVPCSTNKAHKTQEYKTNDICILGTVIYSLNEFLNDVDFEEIEEIFKESLED